MMLPMDQAGALPNSLSPNDAEDGAVMGRSCVNQLPTAWSILLTLGHPTKYVWRSPMSQLGQNAKYLLRANVFRSSLDSGHVRLESAQKIMRLDRNRLAGHESPTSRSF